MIVPSCGLLRTGCGCRAGESNWFSRSSCNTRSFRGPDALMVREFNSAAKWIFAICHGIQVLAAAGVVSGKCFTCYEHVRLELEKAGGIFRTEQAIRDGHIVTAQTWQSHPDFYREVFAC